MRSGNINLYYGSLGYAGVYSYMASRFAHSDKVYAYILHAYEQRVNSSDDTYRYVAFSDDPMCGAEV